MSSGEISIGCRGTTHHRGAAGCLTTALRRSLVVGVIVVAATACGQSTRDRAQPVDPSPQAGAAGSSSSGGSRVMVAGAGAGGSSSGDSSSGGSTLAEAGAGGSAECPSALEVKHGAECSGAGECPSQGSFVFNTVASCTCINGRWDCAWPECPEVCMGYGPTCPVGALPAGCTCKVLPPPPMQNVGGCCCSSKP